MSEKQFSIDQGFDQLDQILLQLSNENIKLSEAVKLYTEVLTVLIISDILQLEQEEQIEQKRRDDL